MRGGREAALGRTPSGGTVHELWQAWQEAHHMRLHVHPASAAFPATWTASPSTPCTAGVCKPVLSLLALLWTPPPPPPPLPLPPPLPPPSFASPHPPFFWSVEPLCFESTQAITTPGCYLDGIISATDSQGYCRVPMPLTVAADQRQQVIRVSCPQANS